MRIVNLLKFKLSWSVRLLLLAVFVGISMVASSDSFLADIETSMPNDFGADLWTPATPTNLGWNVQSLSATPNEGSPDSLDLPCLVGDSQITTENSVAHNWSSVTGDNIKYQREVTFPNSTIGYYYAINNYTPFSSFGGGGGINGLWRTRVRAFEDTNNNNIFDAGDFESAWSEYCDLTLDNTAPDAPEFVSPANDGVVNTSGLVIDWTDETDPGTLSPPVYYLYESATNPGFAPLAYQSGQLSASQIPAPGTPEGEYWIRVKACDQLDNCSDWSSTLHVTVDNTAPVSTITVTNSPIKPVEERVVNGGFETGNLDGWTIGTDADAQVVLGDNYTSPISGQYMLKIGRDQNSGKYIQVNIISQQIPSGVRSVGFDYNFFTKDSLGFDEPGMMVFIDDKQVKQIWAGDINKDDYAGGTYSTGWKHMNVFLGDHQGTDLTIAFYSGNEGDTIQQSWLYLDQVTTKDIVVNNSATFDISTPGDSSSSAFYKIGTNGEVNEGNSFSINSHVEGGIVSYWSVDVAGNEETPQTFSVQFDDEPPAVINDLTADDEIYGRYWLSFTSPLDNLFGHANEYDIRYSTSPITDLTDWNFLPKPDVKNNDGYPGTARAPRQAGERELITLENLVEGQHYYFAMKSVDAAKNWSSISNIAEVNIPLKDGDIVLNEILYDPVGADDLGIPGREWVEIYNNSDYPVDLDGWKISNKTGSFFEIDTANSDNNLNPFDSGETILPSKGYLVVYTASYAGNFFDNEGDTVTLLKSDAYQVVDSHTYSGVKIEGNTEARIPDGTGAWVDPIATPGTANVTSVDQLVPQVKLFPKDANYVYLAIIDAQGYDTGDYDITYTHQFESLPVNELAEDQETIGGRGRIYKEIYLGTCTSGGTCTPHVDVTNVEVELTLTNVGDSLVLNGAL